MAQFYLNISDQDYGAAYKLLSPRYRSGTSFDAFRAGYASTVQVFVPKAVVRKDGSGNVDVTLDATDRKNKGFLHRRFVGYWHLVLNKTGYWKLDNGDFSVTSTNVTP